ncbi:MULTISPECIES: hypothetical protein [unclassified Mesorhizobium]|uniref:hypothetical protein n=1 Tax=unclassified Mesorhizobium TaxID=325217 RepID=UPI00112EAA63|nr:MULTISPECIES: hypothetical protein [unclassified Mesorhizobium]TPJ31090.1 hypothetical protein FJ418_22010 [Mesorhizobium sp. B2-8-3]UCI28008.1 hypothetical protein FJ430_10565 [Mesorhizobium sp. B2-8-5]
MAQIVTALVSFGIPGLALYLFYQYGSDRLGFSFSQIGPVFSGLIAVLFILVFGGLIFYALYKFSAPSPPRSVSHSGELRNLVAQLEKDKNAHLSIQLQGSDQDQALLGKLFFLDTSAPTYAALIDKLCASKSQCMECKKSQNGDITVVSTTKVGNIEPKCLDEGQLVYCCTSS